eukprot:PhF_6_TR33854/c0_g1_i1/m.49659
MFRWNGGARAVAKRQRALPTPPHHPQPTRVTKAHNPEEPPPERKKRHRSTHFRESEDLQRLKIPIESVVDGGAHVDQDDDGNRGGRMARLTVLHPISSTGRKRNSKTMSVAGLPTVPSSLGGGGVTIAGEAARPSLTTWVDHDATTFQGDNQQQQTLLFGDVGESVNNSSFSCFGIPNDLAAYPPMIPFSFHAHEMM